MGVGQDEHLSGQFDGRRPALWRLYGLIGGPHHARVLPPGPSKPLEDDTNRSNNQFFMDLRKFTTKRDAALGDDVA